MDPSLFLVARVEPSFLHEDLSWLLSDAHPYEREIDVDFADSEEISEIFDLYKEVYSQIGPDEPLNITELDQLLEYNRWIVLVDADKIVGFAALKITASGLKLCIMATDGSKSARDAIKTLLRRALIMDGCYAEVSGAPEKIVIGHVPEVSLSEVEEVLQKQVKPDADGRHYRRPISRVGVRKKLLVGKPYMSK